MPQNELLADVLRRDIGTLKMTLADMSDGDLVQRPAPSANNVLWQLGHLIAAEAMMVNQSAGRTLIELPAGFAERYSKATANVDDPAKLGNKAELLSLFEQARDKAAQWVTTLTTADMAKPAPERLRGFFPTVGHIAHLLSSHVAMHLGQIQVLRRKLGKPVLF